MIKNTSYSDKKLSLFRRASRYDNSQKGLWDYLTVYHWRAITLIFWLITAGFLLYMHRHGIHWLSLSDTDDNLRFAEVQDWLHGQKWFDLEQHRLNPPQGANIHWSRLVDIPIAALILLTQPFLGTGGATRFAVAVAPLLPLGVIFFGNALTCRRLIGPHSFLIANGLLLCAGIALGMFLPLRIDHHGWQLAFLSLMIAGNADPDFKRGSLTVAIASTLSLIIGLEMLPYIALTGGMQTLFWVANIQRAKGLSYYGLTLAFTSFVGWLAFASYANRGPVCDALSPVWLSVTVGGGLLLALITRLRGDWPLRFIAAFIVGIIIATGFSLAWPHCLGRPEGISPELNDLWLSHVGEAKPVYTRDLKVIILILSLPVVGIIALLPALWCNRSSLRIGGWITVFLTFTAAFVMTAWQTRTAPAAQILALPSCCWIVMQLWQGIKVDRPWKSNLWRSVTLLLLLSIITTFLPSRLVAWLHPDQKKTKSLGLISKSPTHSRKTKSEKESPSYPTPSTPHPERRCPTIPALQAIEALPPATILTFVDFAPRLIAMTHHRAIAGPYHRNGTAILDVHHAFRGSQQQAENIIRRHAISLVLVCPGMPESSIYLNEAKNGFYAQLAKGQVPLWLEAVPLPQNSPFLLWRVKDRDTPNPRHHNP
ncbi:hypothetical protein [Zymomonas mobilis]|uniref:AcrB/AcrD/AcrF family protein n=1 Tax=Zymomonas mobilis subsp. pomaceae (strain ATCC 29192 / DSM 22645 / JCM 10191 / CCUG 17912 / NBRC 13757 / NCIMB 11200 / NRRL B-4491 / Barker I) TaxID=579138 RepID=F8ES44_ZYMMT|nr:hypothetical protein [Zymomonas mobilis]AEI37619.1 hypothetical protein Zymop_0717 [Zymomonas mobilis subsp. pomaceae ATCC 29192]MDX5948987.1 hypothetical protein [Zymomonas mobilis subsp. pomaceae]GEB88792.1 hypothetical protein ZMO02_04290 [Zymomonas mobilis subsp. pomaceae]